MDQAKQKQVIEVFELLMLERGDVRKLLAHLIWTTEERHALDRMEQRVIRMMELVKSIIE